MSIDRDHFIATLALGMVSAGVLWFVGRQRFIDSWHWRGVVSLAVAIGFAPMVFRNQAGSFAHGFLTPAVYVLVTAVHDMLVRPSQISLRDFEALGLILLPIIFTAVVVFVVWSAMQPLPKGHEQPGT